MAGRPTYEELERRVAELEAARYETDREDAIRALRESEERFRELAELLPETIYEVDAAGSLTFANRSAFDHFGYEPKDFADGLDALEMIAPEDRPRARQNVAKVLSGQVVGLTEYTAITKDGRRFPVLTRSVPILRDDRTVGLRGIIIDITERKRAERELELFRSLINQSNDAIYVIEPDSGRFLYVNDKACRSLGYTREELLELTAGDIEASAREPFDWGYLLAKIRRRSYLIREAKRRRKDGSTFPVETNASLIPWGDREYVVAVSRDLSERKAMERQLQRAQKLEAIGTLAGGVAHDFNNLLTGILAVSTLLLSDIDPDHPHYEGLMDIANEVERGSRLTAQLLNYARRGRYEITRLHLDQLVLEIGETFGRTRKDIVVEHHLADDLQPVEVDEGQMEQVLLNLFVNAGDAMPGGGTLVVTAVNTTADQMREQGVHARPGNYVHVSIADSGMGMDEETLKRIFDPFFTTKEAGKGTGLGLASVYGIIKDHGGYIDVTSARGQGTKFQFFLPTGAAPSEGRLQRQPEPRSGTGTVLLIDDEPLVLDRCARMLRRLGYAVVEASDGRTGIHLYEQHQNRIDLVILDLIMPGLSGREVFDQIERMGGQSKVLISSGYFIEDHAQDLLRRGCAGFIQKPFGMNDLALKLAEALEG